MSQTIHEHGKDAGTVFVQAQGANGFKTPIELPLAAHAVEAIDFEYTLDTPKPRRKGQTGYTQKAGSVHGMRSGSFSMTWEIAPSGAVATEMDPHILLLTGIFDGSASTPTATTVSGGGSTVEVIDVTSAAGISVGDVVGFTDANGTIHAREVEAVDTASSPDNVTVTCPLSHTPADTQVVTASKTYKLNSTNQEYAFTLWHKFSWGGVRLGGCVVNAFEITWGNDPDAPTMKASGFFREYAQARPTTLNGGINNSVTTMAVAGTDWKGITEGMCLEIQAEGGNSAEVVYVNAAVSSASITIERDKDGAGADAHSDAADVYVYEPSPTLSSNVISPDGVTVYISEEDSVAAVELESQTGSISISGGVKARERGHGDTWKVQGYYLSSDLMLKTNFSAHADKATWDWYYRADQADERPVTVQFGDEAGKIFMVGMARQVFAQPKITGEGDAEVGGVLESEDRGSRSAATQSFVMATL